MDADVAAAATDVVAAALAARGPSATTADPADPAVGAGGALLDLLTQRAGDTGRVADAVAELAEDPADPDLRAQLRVALRRSDVPLLEEDVVRVLARSGTPPPPPPPRGAREISIGGDFNVFLGGVSRAPEDPQR